MKKIIAIAAIVASAQASAFMDSANTNANGANNAKATSSVTVLAKVKLLSL